MTNAIRLRYTRSWESARQEQLLYQSESKERICRDNMKQCRDDMENERRCYHNMKEFLICRTDDMKIECNNWKQKFEEDYDSVEMDTQVRRDQIEETLKRTVELQNEYDKRQLKMDTYLKMKQDKIDRELNLVKLTKLTILVQVMSSFIIRTKISSLSTLCRHGGEELWFVINWAHIRKKRRTRRRSHKRNERKNTILTVYYLFYNKLRVGIRECLKFTKLPPIKLS